MSSKGEYTVQVYGTHKINTHEKYKKGVKNDLDSCVHRAFKDNGKESKIKLFCIFLR